MNQRERMSYHQIDSQRVDDDLESGKGTAPPVLKRQNSREQAERHAVFGHTSHFWANDDARQIEEELGREARFGFIRKVYGILTAQMVLTVAVGAACMLNDPLRDFLVAWSSAMVWLTAIPAILVLFALMRLKDQYPLNIQLLFAFTLLEALSIGVICAIYADAGYGAVILEALGITAVVFLSLSLFACQTRVDFTIYSGLLTSLLVSLIVWGFFCSLFGFSTNGLYSWLGTLVFSGFVVVDTQKIMDKFGVDDYIIAAIELYLDILNLFLYILRILSSSRRR